VIAFTGAGGKTTAIFQLARALNAAGGQPVIVSATAHLGTWQIPLADQHFTAVEPGDLTGLREDGVTLITGTTENDRTLPVSSLVLDRLTEICRARGLRLLIEADGSRSRPLKAPAAHEPPIPEAAELVVVTAGLGALGKPLDESNVHRPERFAALSGLQAGEPILPEGVVRVLTHPDGGLRNIPASARRSVLLNQAETPELRAMGGRMSKELLRAFDSVLVGSLQESSFHAIERTAGIILAAGASTRLGQPKQLLEWRGEPFVRAVARTALQAGLDPVIVVTGAHGDPVEAALAGIPVRVVRNTEWEEGQASSIRAGLSALEKSQETPRAPFTGGAIFLLVDQPQVTIGLLKALMETHAAGLQSIVAPLVLDQRANPVLFDRRTFPDLRELRGDVGGRAIFGNHRVEYLPWHDQRLLLDVDTPEAYARLLEDETS
jgi:molybdenum cofactor cytidylyltransferase